MAIDPIVTGLTSDSRQVRPGYLFAALPGTKADGRTFVMDAVERGAAAVLADADGGGSGDWKAGLLRRNVALLVDENPRRRFAQIAAAFHARQPATVMAVTGTNGKTSVAHFTQQLWAAAGHAAGYIGTLGAWGGAVRREGSLTTPDSAVLHEILRDMARDGVTHLAMEASSHGLHQCRADGVTLAVGAFTNLTRDHLDYHGSMDAYRAAKFRLFEMLLPAGATAVLNADSPEFPALDRICRARKLRVIDFGVDGVAIRLREAAPQLSGQRLTLSVFGKDYNITVPLAGRFQVYNAMCALGCVAAGGGNIAERVAALERLRGVPGRMQHVGNRASGAPVFVDYAHTPDALETVLTALRPHVGGRLIVVFGCGGDRDRGKRPLMGERAGVLADSVIVTDDNPRTEDAATIRAEILKGCAGATEIADRETAIAHAIAMMARGDILLIAGKGHESGQIIGQSVIPFSDVDVALRHLSGAEDSP
jgi:UDP-N-acetylmuramoyl-L-alanyl-D-glutamate--2,6-diaminopimelate ligase